MVWGGFLPVLSGLETSAQDATPLCTPSLQQTGRAAGRDFGRISQSMPGVRTVPTGVSAQSRQRRELGRSRACNHPVMRETFQRVAVARGNVRTLGGCGGGGGPGHISGDGVWTGQNAVVP